MEHDAIEGDFAQKRIAGADAIAHFARATHDQVHRKLARTNEPDPRCRPCTRATVWHDHHQVDIGILRHASVRVRPEEDYLRRPEPAYDSIHERLDLSSRRHSSTLAYPRSTQKSPTPD